MNAPERADVDASALVAALAALVDDEMAGALLDRLFRAADDPLTARAVADPLAVLATALPERPARTLRAGIDLMSAHLCWLEDDWSGAATLLDRCAVDVAELLPGMSDVLSRMRGEIAAHDGDPDEARRSWTAAMSGFLAAEDLESAAEVACSLADLAESGGDLELALAHREEAVGWARTAGRRDLGAVAARDAAVLALRVLEGPTAGVSTTAYGLCRSAWRIVADAGGLTADAGVDADVVVALAAHVALAAVHRAEPHEEVLTYLRGARTRLPPEPLGPRDRALSTWLTGIEASSSGDPAVRGRPALGWDPAVDVGAIGAAEPAVGAADARTVGPLLAVDELSSLCADERDDAVPQAFADRIVATASPEARDTVRAAVAVELAQRCLTDGRTAAAAELAREAEPIVSQSLPGSRALYHRVLGFVADSAGDPDAARLHWTAGRRAAVATGAWGQAAALSVVLADAPRGTDLGDSAAAVRDWAVATDCFVAADAPEEAATAASAAAAALISAIGAAAPGDEPLLSALADLVWRAAVDVGDTDLAADTGLLTLPFVTETPVPWADLEHRFATVREQIGLASGDPSVRTARLTMYEGNALIHRDQGQDLEGRLTEAAAVFRANGLAEDEETCRALLQAILSQSRHGAPLHLSADPAQQAAVAFLRGLEHAADGRLESAHTAIAEAARLMREAGREGRALAFEVMGAMIRLAQGESGPLRAAVRSAERALPAPRGTSQSELRVLASLVGAAGAELAGHDGDVAGQIRRYEAVETRVFENGYALLAAKLAVRRAELLWRTGDPHRALEVALPATLALDAVRFALPDVGRRRVWSERSAEGFEVCFRSAAAVGSTTVLAELIEVAREHAIPQPRPAQDRADAMSALGDLLGDGLGEADEPTPALQTVQGSPVAAGETRTVIGLPALLTTPWGTTALAGPLRRAARYRTRLRSAESVVWEVPSAGPPGG